MKLETRLHDVFHPLIKFHITGWKTSMRVSACKRQYGVMLYAILQLPPYMT